MQKAFAKLAKAREALEKSAADPAAGEAVGRFYAFAKGDWDRERQGRKVASRRAVIEMYR